jgi:serine/threonine protein kinase
LLNVNNGFIQEVWLCDFGISKTVEDGVASTFTGTLNFMAPEVWKSRINRPDGTYDPYKADSKYEFVFDRWETGVKLSTKLSLIFQLYSKMST